MRAGEADAGRRVTEWARRVLLLGPSEEPYEPSLGTVFLGKDQGRMCPPAPVH